MNYEHKSNLQKALLSQTWNRDVVAAVVTAIEEEIKKPKAKTMQSPLQIAIKKEKRFKPAPETSESGEE